MLAASGQPPILDRASALRGTLMPFMQPAVARFEKKRPLLRFRSGHTRCRLAGRAGLSGTLTRGRVARAERSQP